MRRYLAIVLGRTGDREVRLLAAADDEYEGDAAEGAYAREPGLSGAEV
jgi:hypothetical protein